VNYEEWSTFVAAIQAAPKDPAPKLVAADWLDEQGKGEWAAFLRVLANPPWGFMVQEDPAGRRHVLVVHAEDRWAALSIPHKALLLWDFDRNCSRDLYRTDPLTFLGEVWPEWRLQRTDATALRWAENFLRMIDA
jgi:uncharacterized protein (TIGR02996 family)